jgi:dihydrofolate reductase
MALVRAFCASSLDGFIAGPGDDLSWLPAPAEGTAEAPPEDFGFDAFMAETACMVMGRATYDVVARFDRWPYGDTPVLVATTRPLEPAAPTVAAVRGTPAELLAAAHDRAPGNVYVDGGQMIRGFWDAGLLDEITVTLIPYVLGSGTPLLAGSARNGPLELVGERVLGPGLVQLVYRPRLGG